MKVYAATTSYNMLYHLMMTFTVLFLGHWSSQPCIIYIYSMENFFLWISVLHFYLYLMVLHVGFQCAIKGWSFVTISCWSWDHRFSADLDTLSSKQGIIWLYFFPCVTSLLRQLYESTAKLLSHSHQYQWVAVVCFSWGNVRIDYCMIFMILLLHCFWFSFWTSN